MDTLILLSDVDAGGINTFQGLLKDLMGKAFGWIIGIAGALVAIWAAYIGIKWVLAQKDEKKVEAKKMVKQFITGIFLIFILAVGVPLLIGTLTAWYNDKAVSLITTFI